MKTKHNTYGIAALLLSSALVATTQTFGAGTAEALIEKHVMATLEVESEKVKSSHLQAVSDFQLYRTAVKQKGSQYSLKKDVFLIKGNDSIRVPEATTTVDMSMLCKIFKKDYALKTDQDAKKLLDLLYAIIYGTDGFSKSDRTDLIVREGSTWYLMFGKFFDDRIGFIVKTNPQGKLLGIKYELGIEK